MARPKSSQSLDSRVFRRIRRGAGGALFSPRDFLDLGGRAAVDKALSRLAQAGSIRRIGRGLYDLPREHPLLGRLSPDPEAVAQKLADREGERLQPMGAAAANMLGLSEQVPARIIYYTDGRARKTRLGNLTIEFHKRAPRQMALAGRPTALVASALRWLGKTNVTVERLTRLHRDMPARDRRLLQEDLGKTPSWMHPFIRYIATGKTTA